MRIYLCVVLAAASCGCVWSGTIGKAEDGRVLVNSQLRKMVKAGGPRFAGKGLERWTATADLKDGNGQTLAAGATLVFEWPGRLAMVVKNRKSVFDPLNGKKSNVANAEALIAELLLEDTLDGFLALHVSGAPLRIIGSGYPDPDRIGEAIDLVSLAMPKRPSSKTAGGVKHYWFDRKTGLLVRVMHPGERVQARLSDWRDVQGNPFPATMTLYDNGAVTYVLSLTFTGIGPESADGAFDGGE
jgi:hypothetical protein